MSVAKPDKIDDTGGIGDFSGQTNGVSQQIRMIWLIQGLSSKAVMPLRSAAAPVPGRRAEKKTGAPDTPDSGFLP